MVCFVISAKKIVFYVGHGPILTHLDPTGPLKEIFRSFTKFSEFLAFVGNQQKKRNWVWLYRGNIWVKLDLMMYEKTKKLALPMGFFHI